MTEDFLLIRFRRERKVHFGMDSARRFRCKNLELLSRVDSGLGAQRFDILQTNQYRLSHLNFKSRLPRLVARKVWRLFCHADCLPEVLLREQADSFSLSNGFWSLCWNILPINLRIKHIRIIFLKKPFTRSFGWLRDSESGVLVTSPLKARVSRAIIAEASTPVQNKFQCSPLKGCLQEGIGKAL